MITWLLSTRSGCLQAAVLLAFVFVCLFVSCGMLLEMAGCPLVDTQQP